MTWRTLIWYILMYTCQGIILYTNLVCFVDIMFSIWPRINAYNYNTRATQSPTCECVPMWKLIYIFVNFNYLITRVSNWNTWCIHVYPYIIYHVHVYEICVHTCNLIKIFIWCTYIYIYINLHSMCNEYRWKVTR